MSNPDKPSSNEEDYFAREEIEKKRKLALHQSQSMASQQRDELKALHYMKCPKCGLDLHSLTRENIDIDTCFNCHGIFLDAGELEQLLKQGGLHGGGDRTWMGAVLNIFKNK